MVPYISSQGHKVTDSTGLSSLVVSQLMDQNMMQQQQVNLSAPNEAHNVHTDTLIECKLRWDLLPALFVAHISDLRRHCGPVPTNIRVQ